MQVFHGDNTIFNPQMADIESRVCNIFDFKFKT